jgi:ribosomal protein S18 acetylase RimI-like enzyme
MSDAITVRDAVPDDADAIARLRALRQFSRADSDRWLTHFLGRPAGDAALHVACADDGVVAYGLAALFTPPADAPPHAAPAGLYLSGVIVDPVVRRRGVGSALVASRLRWAFERGDAAWYFADDDNLASIRLHARFGFAAVTSHFWYPGLRHPDTPMTLYRATRQSVSCAP